MPGTTVIPEDMRMHEPIVFESAPGKDVLPPGNTLKTSRLRNAMARRKLERMRDRKLLRKHVEELWK